MSIFGMAKGYGFRYSLLLLSCCTFIVSAQMNPWAQQKTVSAGQTQIFGQYAGGCIQGAHELAQQGAGYQVMRPARQRYFGHPDLIDFIETLAATMQNQGYGDVLVGDMGMPRGGPFQYGHRSHQTGLDVDIWLRLGERPYSRSERNQVSAISMIDVAKQRENFDAWGQAQGDLIYFAAQDERVSRIFVHPIIKQSLCKMSWPNRAWLAKVRPWWGHNSHMHVRLSCPKDSPDCVNQAPVPAGEGCGYELYSWQPLVQEKPKNDSLAPKQYKPRPKPPAQCQTLLQ
ncbi:Penicillin-insensitive murein endopeptidase [Vibrio stylophorae]|uniref:Penicillin-insensitive murein endopeptidase n=1 Tax=Vibrio stylophorae TaxID=659351 RepID=A0ABM8ZR91_9VIBR|nr:penicillin-insensitive murein endopeptidase [Vibrio stylophorae]CAH0532822.1 Penicillin-insensitive murein endopeptidase [Vibrio stylophorae]